MLERRATSHEERLRETNDTLEQQRQQMRTHLQTASLAEDILYEVFCPSVSFAELTANPGHPGGVDPPNRLAHGTCMVELNVRLNGCVRMYGVVFIGERTSE